MRRRAPIRSRPAPSAPPSRGHGGPQRAPWAGADQATLDGLREAFARAGVTEERLHEAGFTPGPRPVDDTWVLRNLAPEGPPSVLVRLFTIGVSVEADEAAPALAPATPAELVAAGLVEQDGERGIRATVAIRPYRDQMIASDRTPEGAAEPADFVPGVNPVARHLARHTVRRPVTSSLDLGTGNGIQALAAARHSQEVLATDLNPRAIAFAELNARLNGVDNIRFARGSWFEPVADRRFELIVANPPFVISPEADLTYRDSGLAPGELCTTLAREIDSRLAPGGFGHLTCEWGVQDGESWCEAPRRWLAGIESDALVLLHVEADPIEHAIGWNRRLAAAFPDRFEEAVERWTRHHRAHGFRAIAAGTVILRRREGQKAPWFSPLELAASPSAEAGDHVRRLFAGEDLVSQGPERLLSERLRPAEGLQVEQVLTSRERRWHQRRAKLRIRPGLGLEDHVDPDLLDLVFALDGERSTEQVVTEVAARRGHDEQGLLTLVREALPGLVRRGFVLPEQEH